MKRYIRLKEIEPLIDVVRTPPDEYLKNTDGSLSKQDYRCRVDGNGFISTGNDSIDASCKVYFMGASFVESMYCHELDRFPSVVERNIRLMGVDASVFNASYSGSTLLQLFNNLVNKVYAHSGPGSWVFLFSPMSDVDYFEHAGGYWGNSDRVTVVLPPVQNVSPNVPVVKNSVGSILSCFSSVSCNLDLNFVLVTAPFRSDEFFEARRGFLARAVSRLKYNDLVREWASANKVGFIDLDGYLGGSAQFFYDDAHLNELGQRVVSEFLSEKVFSFISGKASVK